MRICILSTVVLKHMVMSSIYTEYFDANKIPYDIIYPDKFHEEEINSATNVYRFEINITKNPISKIREFYKFRVYAKKLLIQNNYNFIIIWNEATTLLFANFLKTHYKGKFCVNVRDIYEPRKIFINYQLKKAIAFAAFTTVSSEKFIDYLPKNYNYIMIHSINKKIMSNVKPKDTKKNYNEQIHIVYIGNIRFIAHAYRLIKALGNDKRYIMEFIGTNSDIIDSYVKLNKVNNVKIIGRFSKEQTGKYLQNADIIYNLYGDEDNNLRTALSNKLYYAIWMHIPILVYKNTYMFTVSNNCGIAFGVNKNDFLTLADDLYSWYHSYDKNLSIIKCEKFKKEALDSHEVLYNLLKDYIF